MNPVTMQVIQALMVLTAFVAVVGVYRKAPGMWDRYLDARERIARLHSEEKDKERAHQVATAADDYKARHADRNILMVGQSELVQQIMAGHERALRIIGETFCKFEKCEASSRKIHDESTQTG